MFVTMIYNLLYCIKDGFNHLLTKKHRKFFVAYLLFVLISWIIQMQNTDTIMFPFLSRILLISFYLVSFLMMTLFIGDVVYRGKITNAFLKIHFQNSKQELPVLIHKTIHDKLLELRFFSQGISLHDWKKEQLAIENALDITISEIKYGKNNQEIIVKACEGRMDFYSPIIWDKRNLTDYSSTALVLGISMGQILSTDLRTNPHCIIAGATGSGKTFLLKHLLLQCILKNYRVVVLDYKGGVDFSADLWRKHTSIILEKEKMLQALKDVHSELRYRQRLFSEEKCKDIDEYNHKYTKIRRIIVACDEISDLLDTTGLDKEEKELTKAIHGEFNSLIRLGRAFGIHLFLATQRPAADVIGGNLKNNASCRIAGKCDDVLSRMILDNSLASDLVPKDSVGVFVNQDGVVFKGFVFDETMDVKIPYRFYDEEEQEMIFYE